MKHNGLAIGFLLAVFAIAVALLLMDPQPIPGALDPDVHPSGNRPDAGAMDGDGNAGGGAAVGPNIERRPDVGTPPNGAETVEGPVMLVRVVDAETGDPVPGATVQLLERMIREQADLRAALTGAGQLESLLSDAASFRTDAQGELRVPRPAGVLLAVARQGDRYARRLLEIDRPAEELELGLRKDQTLHARVVDEAGAPLAGIPVALQSSTSRWARNELLATTGADGRARFPHAQAVLAEITPSAQKWLAIALPHLPNASVPLDPAAADLEDERTLVLPSGGSVVVRVLDHDNLPYARPVEVRLQSADPGDDGRRFRSDPRAGQTVAMTEDGEAHFSYVGIGLHLHAAARLDASGAWFVGTGPGPQAVGDEAVLELRQDQLRAELRFLVFDPDGQPLVDAPLRITERTRSDRRNGERTREGRTDGEGVLRYALGQGELGDATERELELRFRPARGLAEWTGVQDVSFDVPLGVSELATVQLAAPRLLAAGRVAGPRGEAVGGAQVRLYVQREDSRPGRVRWRMHQGAEVRSEDDGSFAIYGMPTTAALELRATHADYLPGSLPAVFGARDHELVLDAGLRLAGRVVADEPAMLAHLAVAFSPEDGATREASRGFFNRGRRVTISADGSFDFGAMTEQRGALQVLDQRTGLMLHEVPGVAPWPADATADGRLDPLDMRGRIDPVALRFTDLRGEPVRNVRFSIMLPGAEQSWWSTAREGNAELFAPPGGVDLLVRTDGYREASLQGVRGERDVRLAPAIALSFELQPSSLASQFDLELRVRPGEGGPRIEPSSMRLDASGRATATAPGPGPLQVYLRVRYVDERGSTNSRYVNFGELGRLLKVDVRDSAGVQVVPVRVTREDILRAMDR